MKKGYIVILAFIVFLGLLRLGWAGTPSPGIQKITVHPPLQNVGSVLVPDLTLDAGFGGGAITTTGAALTLYVDPTGNDANECSASGTSACATIQGAINKIPKVIRHNITINVAAGTYTGAIISGFTMDSSMSTTGGLLISGTRATSTGLISGTATGTATSGTNGDSTITFGTLVDTTQTWTTNDLRGRFLHITGGTGINQVVPIVSNTGTTITVARSSWTTPDATSTYAIEDDAVVINTPVHGVASPLGSAFSTEAGMLFVALSGLRVHVRDIKVSVSAENGLEVGTGAGAVTFQRIQVTDGPSNSSFWLSDLLPGGTMSVLDSTMTTSSTLISHISSFDNAAKSTISLSGLVLVGGSIGIELGSLIISSSGNISIQNVSTYGIKEYLTHMGDRWQSTQITCANSSGVALGIGSIFSASFFVYGPTHAIISSMSVTTCGTGVQAEGPGVGLDISAIQGAAATTGLDVRNGAFITVNGSGYTMTSGTNDINLDSNAATSAFSALSAGGCFTTLGQGSRVCRR